MAPSPTPPPTSDGSAFMTRKDGTGGGRSSAEGGARGGVAGRPGSDGDDGTGAGVGGAPGSWPCASKVKSIEHEIWILASLI